jgi:allantoinase
LEAIALALELAGETRCRLHIVHVSCGAGLALIVAAQRLGVDVTCETCPHYLTLTEEDMLQMGAVAKCAPPLRPKSVQQFLWHFVKSGLVTTIGSDHSPSPPALKNNANFLKVWGGISGVQHTLPLLITGRRTRRNVGLPLIARLTSFNVAQRFKLPPAKGRIALDAEADLALVDLRHCAEVKAEDLFYRHRHSPYVGRALTGRVVQTMLRGQTVFKDGTFAAKPIGRLVRPV